MVYTKTITESSGGDAANPTQRRMPVTAGLIYQFELYFPPGSAGLLHVAVKDGGYQVWPSEPGETFFGDNTLISFPDRYMITAPNHSLDIFSYNLDEAYDHKFQVRIGQVSDINLISGFMPSVQMAGLEAAIGGLVTQQDYSRAAQRSLVLEGLEGEEEVV